MGNIRFKALENALAHLPVKICPPSEKVSEYFGNNTFNHTAMQQYLSREAFHKLNEAIEKGNKIDHKIADQIAAALKAWAISKGATHYTHWFQPLTGNTAEKHDAFFYPADNGKAVEDFNGNNLVQQEPDASSFPSGGIRNTFEARGYTAWDPTSAAFIIDKTLCIPTVFVSYTGEALDYKTPLLKAIDAMDKAAVAVCRYFDKHVNKVNVSLGIEQEYFLVDTALYHARPDLMLSGRTLFGHASAKDQQLDDNYFGSIPERVICFMKDFETEAYLLGIPVKTRHNEVAPNQFECAPIFEEVNLAIDHNQLLMDLMDKVAKRHHFKVLLHEKPYAGINGSGKHNNWSLRTNTGINLLAPGKTPELNLQFLVFLINTIKAVHDHAGLLRASVASAGNDLRLGGNEAPPAIMSVFIGSQLTMILDAMESISGKSKIPGNIKKQLNLNVEKIPEILQDNTDRNRTSPFAFTGNKFEFRAVGSSANSAAAMISLNTIVANQLIQFKEEVDALIKKSINKEEAIFVVLKKYNRLSKPVRFEGNNYSEAWIKEAAKRGLSNITSSPKAYKNFISEPSLEVFERNNIFTKRELEARYEIRLENYVKKIQIEARVLGDLAINHVVPVAIKYQNVLIHNLKGIKELFAAKDYKKMSENNLKAVTEISEHISEISTQVEAMIEERKTANRFDDVEEKARAYNEKVLPYFESIRYHIDKLEIMVDDELWPLPKYRELLFVR
jgi:glutamine synthetase